MSMKLREFISAIRQCKSSGEEATLVAKESAAIRTAFKDESSPYRHRNVAKLMFMNLLGYNVLFGQMECLKLIASNHFLEKRLGYIATSVLLDHSSDILMLATNTIKNDLSCGNQYIISAALTALGNIGTSEMIETLSREIDDILNGTNPSLRKRAVLLAAKMVRQNPETSSKFIMRVATLLNDYNHSVIIATTVLIEALLIAKPEENGPHLIPSIPVLCRFLRELIAGSPSLAGAARAQTAHQASPVASAYGYRSGTTASMEYDFNGVNDPFLQMRILKTFRVYVETCPQLMKDNDSLTPVIEVSQLLLIPADNYRNGALSLVYESVRLALAICRLLSPLPPSPDNVSISPRSLSPRNNKDRCVALQRSSLEWLDHFLTLKDNTVKYVAIGMLAEIAEVFPDLVKKYRATVIDSLREGDISLQLRAVALVSKLTDTSNAMEMTTELLNFLLVITDPLPTVKPQGAPLGKDVSFAEGTTVIVAGNSPPPIVTTQAEHKAKAELIKVVIEKIEYAIDNFATSRSWQLDSLIRLCCLAGNVISNETKEKIANTLLATPELQGPAIGRLAMALKENMFQVALAEIAVWCIGEFIGKRQMVCMGTSSPQLAPIESASPPSASLLDDLLDETPKCTESLPTTAANEGESLVQASTDSSHLLGVSDSADDILDGEATEQTQSTHKLSANEALDLIESLAKVYGYVRQGEKRPQSSGAIMLIQNSDLSGLLGSVDGSRDCIKQTPNPNRHIIKSVTYEIHPQAALPPQAVKAIKASNLSNIIIGALAKIAASQPSLCPRVLKLYEQLQETCLSFDIVSRIAEYRMLLSPPLFSTIGCKLLASRPEISKHVSTRRPDLPVGPVVSVSHQWPTREDLI